MWLEDLEALAAHTGRPDEHGETAKSGPVRVYRATPEQAAAWKKERDEILAKRADIMKDRAAGMSRIEIAEKHGISTSAVDNHIYNAKKAAQAARQKGLPVEQAVKERVEPTQEPFAARPEPAQTEAKQPEPAPVGGQSMHAIPPVPAARKSRLRPAAYAGDYATYRLRDGCVSMVDLPDKNAEMFTAAQLREFAAELCEVADVLECASA